MLTNNSESNEYESNCLYIALVDSSFSIHGLSECMLIFNVVT